MLPGIDVSNHNQSIDWRKVANAGKLFAIIKSSEGTGFVDPFFAQNWQGAKANGLVRGAYHFARPSANGPVEEADFFLSTIGDQVGDLEVGDLLALDFEDPNMVGDQGDWALEFLQHVEAVVGFKPLLYSGAFILADHASSRLAELSEYGLWLANFRGPDLDTITMPSTPSPWPFIAIWQHWDQGRVPGVHGDCDLDAFNSRSIENLKKYGKLPAVVPV